MRANLLVLAVVLAPSALAPAQVERYELGRRLKRFEAEWEKQPDPAARKRALAILPKASTMFHGLRLGEAARAIDDAYWALKSADPPAAGVRWLDSLCVVPEKRAIAARDSVFKVVVKPFYTVPGGPPAGATARLTGIQGHTVPVPPAKVPVTVEVGADSPPFSSGVIGPLDGLLTLELQLGRTELRNTVGVSRVRLPDPGKPDRSTVAGATAAAVHELAAGVLAGDVPETDLRLDLWLTWKGTAERPCWVSKPDTFGGGYMNGVWAAVPTGKDTATPCRLFVPENLSKDRLKPLVVALHGAGGSENLFFESYGAGHIVKECQKRGWLLVSPRSGLLGTPPIADIVTKLAERYPIDPKRVFLVGHSMGAGQAIDLVQRHPGRFAAVAVLGGGGRVRKPELFADLPVFVGMGTADFALRSGKALVKALGEAGAERVTAKEYDGLEHLTIVRESLPDVFGQWDTLR